MFRICMSEPAGRRKTHRLFTLAVGCLPRSNMGRIRERVEARVCLGYVCERGMGDGKPTSYSNWP